MPGRQLLALIAVATLAVGGIIYALSAAGIGTEPDAGATVAGADAPMAAAAIVLPQIAAAETAFAPEQQAAIYAMIGGYIAANPGFIRDYLIANPEVIREAVTELEQRRIDDESLRQARAIAQYRELLFYSPRQAVLGNPAGDVTIVEFFDYNCTYCKRALDDMNRLIAGDPNLRVVLKEFPVLGAGSTEAAQVAAAVIMVAPERYGDFHQLLLSSPAGATGELALAAAAEIGLDRTTLLAAMASNEIVATIEESYVIASALGLTGTPSYVIGDVVVVGAVGYDILKAMIESVRRCGATAC